MVGGRKTGGEGEREGGWQLGRERDKGMVLGKIAKGEGRGRKGEMEIDRRSQWLTVEVEAGDDTMDVSGSVMDGNSGRRRQDAGRRFHSEIERESVKLRRDKRFTAAKINGP